MNYERRAHGVIHVQNYFLVVGGGLGELPTEKCRVDDASLSCTVNEPHLTDYAYHPELFLVSEDFCV